MNRTHIVGIGTANPPHQVSREQSLAFLNKALQLNDLEQRRLKALYYATTIENRYSVLEDYLTSFELDFDEADLNSVFSSTSQRMQLYQTHACPLAIQAIEDCFKSYHLETSEKIASKITHLITVSCTGMYAPGLDIELVESLGLNPSIQRFCINFMGCYAAFNALKVADAICKSDANAKVLMVGVELCSIHLQKSKKEDDLLANALFADGAAAVLLEANTTQSKSLSLEAFHCDLVSEGKHEMAWAIGDFGFEMKLSSYVPSLLETKMKELVNRLLDKLALNLSAIDWFAIHPGGRKILEVIERCLGIPQEKNKIAYHILKNYGNMSSVTVFFVLKEILNQLTTEHHHQNVLSMAFGPGLTVESALMKVWM
jgi:alpha-pyrone synthase